ncbi:hypothetical protein NGRA_2254 [Nosema granulosis]|uniref:Serine aminopeptidase S33 domain-containing protein n=1 Tax=Nosema granulosis TaxID=83296 RepID=A0A9P6GY01_9MICR|nr:hypothetical protein NGRA_2254 [Nosema granulosis]
MKNRISCFLMVTWNILFLISVLLFVFQRRIYLIRSWERLENSEKYKTVKLEAEDGNPVDLRFIDNGEDVDVFVMFGNVIEERMYVSLDILMKNIGIQCNVFSYFYRGFLNNPGRATEEETMRDLQAVGKYLKTRKKRQFAFAFSFGCAVVLKLANINNFEGIVLINPFASLRSTVESIYIFKPVACFLVDTWDNVRAIKKVKNTPILIFTSEQDSVVPPEHSAILKRNNEDAKQEILLKIDHNDIFKRVVMVKILMFLKNMIINV